MIDARFKRPRLLQRLIGAATLDLLTAAFLAIVAVAAAIMPVPAAAASADTMVRGDWYFRESLSAIRDWEAILTRWEQEAPPRARVPVFPVPIDGGVVDWPNPIPLLLLAAEDRHLRERVRWVEGEDRNRALAAARRCRARAICPGAAHRRLQTPGRRRQGPVVSCVRAQVRRAHHLRRETFAAGGAASLAVGSQTRAGGSAGNSPQRDQPDVVDQVVVGTRYPAEIAGIREALDHPGRSGKPQVNLPMELAAEGGALFVLKIGVAGEVFWLPLSSHPSRT